MDDKPNVTVIYQTAPSRAPGPVAVIVEGLFFLFMLGLVALGAGIFGRW